MSEPKSSDQVARRRLSLAGKFSAAFFAVLVLMAALAAGATLLPLEPWVVFLIVLVIGLPFGAWLLNRLVKPINQTVQGLSDGIRSFHDRDFSVRLATHRNDELGDIARLYNRVGELLLQERQEVREKELLLQTALNRSPAAIVLFNALDRVIYSNREARNLFLGGSKLEGLSFDEIREGCPGQMKEVLASRSDGIFSVPGEEHTETYHLSQRGFRINRQRHILLLLRRLTHELDRQEAEIWKKVIRVISHELRNSLAPVSSFVHSAQKMAQDPQHRERIEEVFEAIQERLGHLTRFIEGYAQFARLPRPRKESVEWADLLSSIEETGEIEVVGRLPNRPGFFDLSQMRQVLINLVRNAVEASEGRPLVSIRIKSTDDGGVFLQVMDRGRGMDEATMQKALLPFYSTKQTGSGLGLALCREILEAHGGRIVLQARDEAGTIVTCWLPAG